MNRVSALFQRAFDPPTDWQTLVLAFGAALLVAWVVARTVRRLAARGIRAMLGDALALSSPAVRAPLRLIGAATFILVLALLIVPIFELAGLRPRTGIRLRTLVVWGFSSGLRVLLIGALAYALVRTSALFVRRFEYQVNLGTGLGALERAKRARTLGTLIRNVSSALIVGAAALMILRELGINIAPILTGAGIIGLAVGFGAQTLVRDIISGFFLILEDQVRVGDAAAINGTAGLVEAINLRTVVLRDVEGTVHVFPNGAINTLANRSKEYSYYVIDLGLSYSENPDRVTAVLRSVGEELQSDERFGPLILEPLEIMGVDAFADWWVQLKLRIKTVPLKQWDVGRELRRRILMAFEEHGIEIPPPALRPAAAASSLSPAPASSSAPATPGRS
jgi:small conductance mechanosensitive channel